MIFIIRGAIIAMDCRNSFDALVAIGCVSMLALQSFIIIGGVTKFIPLTGITMPFVSYGGSSILSCFFILGILEGLAVKNGDADEVEFAEWNEQQEAWEDDYYDEDEYDYDGYENDYGYEEEPYYEERSYTSRRNRQTEPEPMTRREAKRQAKQAKAQAKEDYKQAKQRAKEQAKRRNRRPSR